MSKAIQVFNIHFVTELSIIYTKAFSLLCFIPGQIGRLRETESATLLSSCSFISTIKLSTPKCSRQPAESLLGHGWVD